MRKPIRILGYLMILMGLMALGAYVFAEHAVRTPLNSKVQNTQKFSIRPGQGVEEIGRNLKQSGLIGSDTVFKYFVWRSGLKTKLKAGSYELSPAMSIEEITGALAGNHVAGLRQDEVQVSIPEGFSNAEILSRLRESGAFNLESDFNDVNWGEGDFIFLPEGSGIDRLQGYLFPDTYRFKRGASLTEISGTMLKNFESRVYDPLKGEVENSGKDFRDVLILASIVEKEAAHSAEMADIAGVFQNRLSAGQKLQSDATVNYVIGEGRARATSKDLEIDSPFNTYKYKGLPPAPICNPGLAAIEAVLNPTKHGYYYFLTTQDAARQTYFAKTYEEHLENKVKYLK